MRRIDEDIQTGQFQNLYLLYGDEEYLKQQYKKKLISALVNDGDTMNFARYEGKDARQKSIVDFAETVPFLAKPVGPDGKQYRVILIEESGLGDVSASKTKNSTRDEDIILDYLSEIPEFTIFIFVETKANGNYRLFKAAKSYKRDINMTKPNEADLQRWIGGRLKANGKQMKRDAWDRFLIMTGESMNNMEMELEKLINYVGDRDQITVDDVNAICVENLDVKIYELTDAISTKDTRKTFDIYNTLLAAKEKPRDILSAIVALYRRMVVIKEMSAHGKTDNEIASVIGTQGYYVKINRQRARNFSTEEIQSFLKDASDFTFKINTGQMNETMAVELLLMKYS